MTWHYLRESEVESSEESFQVFELLPPLKRMPSVGRYCSIDNGKDFCQDFQSGMILKPSMEYLGGEESILSPEDFHANPLASQENALERMTIAISGRTQYALLERFPPPCYSWKMCRDYYLPGFSEPYLEAFPTAGIVSSGELYLHYNADQITLESDFGSSALYRTPSARDWKGMSAASWRSREKGDLTPTLADQLGGTPNPEFVGWLMGLPEEWTNSKGNSKESAMRKFRRWQELHGIILQERKAKNE